MSAFRHTHRQMDWRKLNIAHGDRQYRCHDRSIYGQLQPMDDPNRISGVTWLWAAVFISPFVAAYLGVLGQ